jgi:hypothetical protein
MQSINLHRPLLAECKACHPPRTPALLLASKRLPSCLSPHTCRQGPPCEEGDLMNSKLANVSPIRGYSWLPGPFSYLQGGQQPQLIYVAAHFSDRCMLSPGASLL